VRALAQTLTFPPITDRGQWGLTLDGGYTAHEIAPKLLVGWASAR
jgi:hypothetical protein